MFDFEQQPRPFKQFRRVLQAVLPASKAVGLAGRHRVTAQLRLARSATSSSLLLVGNSRVVGLIEEIRPILGRLDRHEFARLLREVEAIARAGEVARASAADELRRGRRDLRQSARTLAVSYCTCET